MGSGALFESGGAAALCARRAWAREEIAQTAKGTQVIAQAVKTGKNSAEALQVAGVSPALMSKAVSTLRTAGLSSESMSTHGLFGGVTGSLLRPLGVRAANADKIAKGVQLGTYLGFSKQHGVPRRGNTGQPAPARRFERKGLRNCQGTLHPCSRRRRTSRTRGQEIPEGCRLINRRVGRKVRPQGERDAGEPEAPRQLRHLPGRQNASAAGWKDHLRRVARKVRRANKDRPRRRLLPHPGRERSRGPGGEAPEHAAAESRWPSPPLPMRKSSGLQPVQPFIGPAEGAPKKIFHGTGGEGPLNITELDAGKHSQARGGGGIASYFSEDPTTAAQYVANNEGGKVIAGVLHPNAHLLDAREPLPAEVAPTLVKAFTLIAETSFPNEDPAKAFERYSAESAAASGGPISSAARVLAGAKGKALNDPSLLSYVEMLDANTSDALMDAGQDVRKGLIKFQSALAHEGYEGVDNVYADRPVIALFLAREVTGRGIEEILKPRPAREGGHDGRDRSEAMEHRRGSRTDRRREAPLPANSGSGEHAGSKRITSSKDDRPTA